MTAPYIAKLGYLVDTSNWINSCPGIGLLKK